jgi:hypothetical protein
MTLNHFTRRLHVYLALTVFPWVLMYGVSAFVINHHEWFDKQLAGSQPKWTERLRRPYDRPVPADANLQSIGKQIADHLGLEGRHYAYKPGPKRLIVNVQGFWSNSRATYDLEKQEVVAEDERFQWNGFLIRMHERSGYAWDSWLEDAWAVFVDAASAGFLVLIGSGLWMWWQLPRTRWPGLAALLGGIALFISAVLAL